MLNQNSFDTESNMNNKNVLLREDLVNTAVNFLLNPNVSSSPLNQKQKFLESKGLSSEEIKRAFDIISMRIANKNDEIPFSCSKELLCQHNVKIHSTMFVRIKEFFNILALIGASVYLIYWFYKKFIEKFIFKSKKNVLTEKERDDKNLNNVIEEMKDSILKMEEGINRLICNNIPDPTIPNLVQELKQDLTSLKGLLLSRKSFPSVPPSIPSWQLDTTNQSREKTSEDDAASGSSANNSDSSLEMIREDTK